MSIFRKLAFLALGLSLSPAAIAGTVFTTLPATDITKTTATLNGSSMSTVGLSGVFFHWGLTTDYTHHAAAIPQNVNGPVHYDITALTCGTTYHFQLTGTPHGTTHQGQDLTFTTKPCHNAPFTGFAGPFAPSHWSKGENPPMGLINTSAAPVSVTLQNYAAWQTSGATFVFASAPSDGTVAFTYSLSGATASCPGTYLVAGQPTVMNLSSGSTNFGVQSGQSFGFALNGQSKPGDFACVSDGSQVTLTISNFVFTPG